MSFPSSEECGAACRWQRRIIICSAAQPGNSIDLHFCRIGGQTRTKSALFFFSCFLYIVTHMRSDGGATPLGEFEQLVLLALLRLGNGAFGAAIHREIAARAGRAVSASAVYVAASTTCSTRRASAR
jgi:hypothetical protein